MKHVEDVDCEASTEAREKRDRRREARDKQRETRHRPVRIACHPPRSPLVVTHPSLLSSSGDRVTMKTATIIIIIIISLPNGTSAVLLQLSLPPSVDALEGGSLILPCSFSPLPIDLNALFIKWWIVSDKIEYRRLIYDSHNGNHWPKVAEFAGAEVNGDCSLRIINVSRTDNLAFRCRVLCHRCNAENTEVEGRVKLNLAAAVPRSHGDAGGRTVVPGVETSPTHSLDSLVMGLLVVQMMTVILSLGAVAISTIKIEMCGWLLWISCLTDSGNGRAEVKGDVNGVLPLMTNGEPVQPNGSR